MLIALAFIAFAAMIASWLFTPEKTVSVAKPVMTPVASAAAAAD